jgi:hypothetical protein
MRWAANASKSPVREANAGLETWLEAVDLDEDVFLAPEDGKARQPILLLDRLMSGGPSFGRKYSCRRRVLRTGDFTSDGAGSDSHLGIIADALVFPRVAARHHVNLVIFLSKPDRRRDGRPTLAECDEADVFLPLNLWRDWHRDILRREI